MKAAVLHEVNKPLVIEDVSVPNPGPREVLIRTRVAGLCHSDLHFMEGLYPHPLPAVLGHESAGVVEKVGSDDSAPQRCVVYQMNRGTRVQLHRMYFTYLLRIENGNSQEREPMPMRLSRPRRPRALGPLYTDSDTAHPP